MRAVTGLSTFRATKTEASESKKRQIKTDISSAQVLARAQRSGGIGMKCNSRLDTLSVGDSISRASGLLERPLRLR